MVANLWGKKYRSCRRSVCPPACPTNSSSHFCPKNSVCHRQKPWTNSSGCVDRNHRDVQPSRPRLFTDGDYVMSFSEFSNTTHYKCSAGLDWQRGHQGNTPMSSSWHVLSRLFRNGSGASLCVNDQRRRIDKPPLWCVVFFFFFFFFLIDHPNWPVGAQYCQSVLEHQSTYGISAYDGSQVHLNCTEYMVFVNQILQFQVWVKHCPSDSMSRCHSCPHQSW